MRDEERAERLRWKTQLRLETDQWTGRAARAHHHAKMMMATLDKFIADACRDAAFEELLLSFFTSDTEIVRVPPERDAEHAAALKAAAFSASVSNESIGVSLGQRLATAARTSSGPRRR